MKNGWVVDKNGAKRHYVNDVLHNDDGPALIMPDGTQVYYEHGKFHRVGGPAWIGYDGMQTYWQHGKRHREDGPAIIWLNGYVEYWLFGVLMTKEHLALMGRKRFSKKGFTKEQVTLFMLLCMDEP